MTGRPDVDSYLARTFDLARYNCWHMLRDVWMDLTGRDLGDRTPERISTEALLCRFDSDVPQFRELMWPRDPCIVLMTRPAVVPHVGAFFNRRVLQMTSSGASFMPLEVATAGFERARYFDDR